MEQHPNWQEETDHLTFIRRTIARLLAEKAAEVKILTEEEAGINRDMWDEIGNFRDLEGISEFMQYIGQLKQNMAWARFNRQEIERLDRLYLSPYFARIDFGADGETPTPCYIGISTLMDDDTAKVYIHDWRAPLSSLFYDWEPGAVSFKSPAGIVHGHMTLKRQYRLEQGHLTLLFDAGLAINDEILQEILAGATGGHMRQIVASIQKEQNRAIRFEDTRVLAVQGAAGSGKTSIAMHRAAYLLYRHRQTIKPENLVILSPNALLGEYIADVLPELGEDRIAGTPFTALAAEMPELASYKLETPSDLMESTLSHPSPGRLTGLHRKASPRMLQQLEAYVEKLSEAYPFEDLVLQTQTVVSGQELSTLYAGDFRQMGIGRRLERIRIRIHDQLNGMEKSRLATRTAELEEEDPSLGRREARAQGRLSVRQEFARLREDLDRQTTLDPVRLYRRFITETLPARMVKTTLHQLDGGVIPFEDLGPVFYLALACSLHEPDTKVRHVLVDEAQDFTRIHYAVLRLLYPRAGFTLLGDANQNIRTESAIGDMETAAALLDPESHAVLRLYRTYRCTLPISRLADQFCLESSPVEHFGRPGSLPELILAHGNLSLPTLLPPLLRRARESGHHTMAVLTRTLSEAKAMYDAWLQDARTVPVVEGFQTRLVSETYHQPLEGLLFLPSWLAKGLEFEEVLLVFGTDQAYADPAETGLLHTACTRALHRLTLLSMEEVPAVLEGVPSALYARESPSNER